MQKLLYFRIFNNKYIEMAFKDIKIMLLRSENHHQVFKMIVIIIMYLHNLAIYFNIYCIFAYLLINTLKWSSKISKLCYVVFSRRKIKQKFPNIHYYIYIF